MEVKQIPSNHFKRIEVVKTNPRFHLNIVKVEVSYNRKEKEMSGTRTMLFIDEAGLNQLIMLSRKRQALAHREWVFGTVLPTIRKTGSYSAPGFDPSEKMVKILERLMDRSIKSAW